MFFNTITEYLCDTFNSFLEEINGMSSLCDLRNVSFESGKLPDYTNRAQALLYCLRYHFGYAFEYEYIYINHILNSFDSDQINILSIGCGNGIDLWALDHAIKRSGSQIKCVNYIGVDRVDWKAYFDCSLDDHVKYIQCEITELQEQFENIDVLILPKSISELNEDALKHIAKIITCSSDELYVVASFRSDLGNLCSDGDKFEFLINQLANNGYAIIEGNLADCYDVDGPDAIVSHYNDYIYPDEALDYICNLYSTCKQTGDNEDCKTICSNQLSRKPILTKNYIRYNIVKLRR